LRERLSLAAPPARIECFDVSTIQGAQTVGSRVVFQDALPDKDAYRRFRVRTVPGQDDFASMREILMRRFARDDTRPDLVVIDGGAGQLGEAVRAAPAGTAIVGLAKAKTLRGGGRTLERVYLPGQRTPIVLPPDAPETYLLARIRDEAHRFAITYHRKLRDKQLTKSVLDDVPGLGPTRRKRLLKEFGSVKRLREQPVETFLELTWLPDQVARDLYEHPRSM
jgi:excinuclease ABC subunit C